MKHNLFAVVSSGLGLSLLGCGWGGTPPGPGCAAYTSPPASAGYAYVCVEGPPPTGNPGSTAYIQSYPLFVNGNNPGTTQFVLPAGGSCGKITGDGAGTIYQVIEGTPNTSITVNVFTADAGVLTLKRSFSATLGSQEIDPAADRAGNLYLQEANNTLVEFGVQASGPASPMLTLTMPESFTDMITDSAGNLYAATAAGSILEFPAGFTTATPSTTMDVSATIPSGLTSIAINACGNIAASSYTTSSGGNIFFFPPIAGGSATPTRKISGTAFVQPTDLFIGSSGITTVFDGNLGGTIYVDTFAADAQGNATPLYGYNEELIGQNPHRSVVY